MKRNFWDNLPKPFFVQAPMADVSDIAFRILFAKYGKPDVMWTEFVSADGLCSRGRDNLLIDLKFEENQRPIVAQIFSAKPEMMEKASKLIRKLGFDGIDINMGCPEKSICSQGCGAAMIKTPELARQCIAACIKGAGGLPVSVKTRTGFSQHEIETWVPELLKEDIACLTIHARTRKEMSKVPADWSLIKRAVEIRNELGSKTLIVGNGDVENLEQAKKRVEETDCDGVMIGRGMFGNPWVYNRNIKKEDLSLEQIFEVAIEHTKLYEKYFTGIKPFDLMKKHFKAYINGFDGAKELRMELMKTTSSAEVEKILKEYIKAL